MSASEAGFAAVGEVAAALDGAGVEYWLFGGWAVDVWVGRRTRDHDDIDVLVWRADEAAIDEALSAAGWRHAPTEEDVVGTNYVRDGLEVQLTYAVRERDDGAEGADRMVVPVPDQPLVLSEGPLGFAVRESAGAQVRVLPLQMMVALKTVPRPDESGGAKDRADLSALLEVADDGAP